jgi:hypothetical protein
MHPDTANDMAMVIMERLGSVGCKTALRLAERAILAGDQIDFGEDRNQEEVSSYAHIVALAEILDDLAGDEATATKLCEVI